MPFLLVSIQLTVVKAIFFQVGSASFTGKTTSKAIPCKSRSAPIADFSRKSG